MQTAVTDMVEPMQRILQKVINPMKNERRYCKVSEYEGRK